MFVVGEVVGIKVGVGAGVEVDLGIGVGDGTGVAVGLGVGLGLGVEIGVVADTIGGIGCNTTGCNITEVMLVTCVTESMLFQSLAN